MDERLLKPLLEQGAYILINVVFITFTRDTAFFFKIFILIRFVLVFAIIILIYKIMFLGVSVIR